MRFRVELPIPPSSNNAYVNTPGKGRSLKSVGRDWKDIAVMLIKRASGGQKFDSWVTVTVTFYRMNWVSKNGKIMKQDLDNRVKLLFDALSTAAFTRGDELIWSFTAHKGIGPDWLLMHVETLGGASRDILQVMKPRELCVL